MDTTLPVIHAELIAQVSADYVHAPKIAQPRNVFSLSTTCLKWYGVYPAERPFADHEVEAAQAFLADEVSCGRLALEHEVGFVVQHRCLGGDILYVCTWRENNEVWETLYFKQAGAKPAFEVVSRATKTGTFCVWVIPVVAHEQRAWVKFLTSKRDNADLLAYFCDCLCGSVG